MKPPKILLPGTIDEINEYLCKKTGCFAFLSTKCQWTYAEPKSGKEAFELWSIALYSIYYDYGCEYLKYILSKENAPTRNLDEDIGKCNKHVNRINRVLRPNFAHGIFSSVARNELRSKISQYYMRSRSEEDWNIYFESLSDEDWQRASECLKCESDFLVETLYAWADEFDKALIPISILNPREKFGQSSMFKKSISYRVVFDSLDKDYVKGDSACKILDRREKQNKNQKNSEDMLKEWQDAIQKEFLAEKIKRPEEIINKLRNYLYEVHNPLPDSSVAFAAKSGFSLNVFE